ncbi:MAG: GAF domain-containing sensor histidine kinase [Firmicutes bacterium]|nr:GAF domain-containing sensor histidine kinase [Alicyclobacillaceae bacterium]MCL6496100.1 GAF domain-containing sensor histidine kinase [Bacillota bacterium]
MRGERFRPAVVGLSLDPELRARWEAALASDTEWVWRGAWAHRSEVAEWEQEHAVGLLDADHPEAGQVLAQSQDRAGAGLRWIVVGRRPPEAWLGAVGGWLPERGDAQALGAAIRLVIRDLVVADRQALRALAEWEETARRTGQELAEAKAYQRRLRRLSRGMAAIASLRSVEVMLQRVVELAREVVGARYGALAVLNRDESIAQFITAGLAPEVVAQLGSLPRGRGLLGEVIRTRRPLRVDEIARHPASVGWPPHHPPMHAFLGVPMIYQDQVVGHLYLTDKDEGRFTDQDQELIELLAAQAAALISNARLNQDIERLAVVEERQRISMDLHDGTLQTIFAVLLGLDTVLQELPESAGRAREALNAAADRLSRATQEIRRYIMDLKRTSQDLLESIQTVTHDLAIADKVHIHTADYGYRALSLDEVEHLTAWVREALTNVVRHAHAERVDITWRQTGDQYQIVVEDDGVGFDLAELPPAGHHGLNHLRQRAERLGGRVQIHSRPRHGTRVELVAPLTGRAG